MKVILTVEVDVDENGQYVVFGSHDYICSDHRSDDAKIKGCVLGTVKRLVEEYGLTENPLDDKGLKIRKEIFDSFRIIKNYHIESMEYCSNCDKTVSLIDIGYPISGSELVCPLCKRAETGLYPDGRGIVDECKCGSIKINTVWFGELSDDDVNDPRNYRTQCLDCGYVFGKV